MMPREKRALLWLPGLAKLVAVILVAGGVGIALGIWISKLSGDEESSGATSSGTGTNVPSTTAALAAISVTTLSAILHVATTPSGQSRERARLGVHLSIENRGDQRLVLDRPALLSGGQSVATKSRADEPGPPLGPIDAGKTLDVTLGFETVGAATKQLATRKSARILIGGRSLPITVKVGTPLRSSP